MNAESTPDSPGLYDVTWSNGQRERVEVFEESGKLFWREPDKKVSDSYPIGNGWLAKWRRAL